MVRTTNAELLQVVSCLDDAITQAIENPLRFIDSSLLDALGASCQTLQERSHEGSDLVQRPGVCESSQFEERAALLWQVRDRAGRFQMLMDTANRFYSSCFSSSQPGEWAYGVHGEWSVATSPSHLLVDC